MAIRHSELLKAVFSYMEQEAARTANLLALIRYVLSMGDFFP
jgi:hypothetical protein